MINSDLRNLFGLAVTAAYIRAKPYGGNIPKLMCQALAKGFGLNTSDGNEVYSKFVNEHPENATGLLGAPYTTYEQQIYDIISSFVATASTQQKEILTIAAHAMIFAYSINSATNLSNFRELLGEVLTNTSFTVSGVTLFERVGGKVIIPFTEDIVRTLIANDYTDTIALLNSSPKTSDVTLVNYNWYDVSSILKGPDLQIMKDVENQYYYLSGEMIYKAALDSLEPCIEDETTISSTTGNVTFTYVRNLPCSDPNVYIGPVNYVKFKRIFNDGPHSSGRFSGDIPQFYIDNDKNILDKREYLTNSYALQGYTGDILATAFVDANGQYSIETSEYANAPYTATCTTPYQSMHIGDNRPRFITDTSKCTYSLKTVTGFKFASLELPDEHWTSDLQFRQTNPLSDFSRILKRSWSISDNPYLATADGNNVLWPYFKDIKDNEYWYIGYPVLNGVNDIPQLAFFQTFDSPTFGTEASIVIYPSIGTSDGNTAESTDSVRTHQISTMQLLSGRGTLPIKFNTSISSNLSGQDIFTQKFFGMGNAFSGQYNIVLTQEENAGFFYTGFVVTSGATTINSSTLADAYNDSIIGKYETIKYISGYKRLSDGKVYELTNKFAKNATGDIFTYAYISQTDTPEVTIQENNWSYFAPVPSALEGANYERTYAQQTVESYFPRFYDGPFSVETRKFLYPNMDAADKTFGGKLKGVPTGISFKVKVREEAVKEIYGKYNIYQDGEVDDTPEFINVIRPDIRPGRDRNPVMYQMFVPNREADGYYYDFNKWNGTDVFDVGLAMEGFVDNNWAPITSGYVILGKNNNEYNVASLAYNLFERGLRKTSIETQASVTFTSPGVSGITYTKKPITDGLFHAFTYCELTGTLAYVPPIFDLSQNAIVVSDGLQKAFPIVVDNVGLDYYHYRGTLDEVNTGQDPLFFQYMGGRRGSILAEQEGGYHTHGLIGDRWNGIVYKTYGLYDFTCKDRGSVTSIRLRSPAEDETLLLLNAGTYSTDIWTNGLNFSPYKIDRNKTPLSADMPYPYTIGTYQDNLTVFASGGYINFNLREVFPELKVILAAPEVPEWYYPTGVLIGPFDRDIELGLLPGQTIVAYSEFYINGQMLSHWFQEASACDRDWSTDIAYDRTISCGQPDIKPRNADYTILAVIPSGETAILNIRALPDENSPIVETLPDKQNHPSLHLIGLASGVILSMRTHVPLDTDIYDARLYSGEEQRLNSYFTSDNGRPKKYTINHPNGLEGLVGVHQFVYYGSSGKLYPIPDEAEFQKWSSTDSLGNISYPSYATVENYWRNQAIKNNSIVTFSGYREGSRVSFEIYDVQMMFDKIPYQSYDLVIPSGNCILSGEMGYYAQADNCIFTEGIHLINATENDDLAETYNPSYASDVLKRIPSDLFQFPTTVLNTEPVLPAPSVMKQRENESGITDGQRYSYLLKTTPYGYNKLLWPALSDLETLNPGETIEAIAPGDGDTFSNSTMLFSASQGQSLPNGLRNPNVVKAYYLQDIFQTYDSVATDALINSGYCITSGRGTSVILSQQDMSGALAPIGASLNLIAKGLV